MNTDTWMLMGILLGVAAKRATITYTALGQMLGLNMGWARDRAKLGDMLGEIADYTHEQWEIILASVAVGKGDNLPSGRRAKVVEMRLGHTKVGDRFVGPTNGNLYEVTHVGAPSGISAKNLTDPTKSSRPWENDDVRMVMQASDPPSGFYGWCWRNDIDISDPEALVIDAQRKVYNFALAN